MTWMCAALEVSSAGYYAWCQRPVSAAQERREAIREIHAEVKGRYGSPRIKVALEKKGFSCSVNTVAKLMRDNDIQARSPRRFVPATTDSGHGAADRGLVDGRDDAEPAGGRCPGDGGDKALSGKRRDRSSSTSRCFTTGSACTRLWSMSPPRSTSGRTTPSTLNFVSTFPGEAQHPPGSHRPPAATSPRTS